MKIKLSILSALFACVGISQGAISLTGTGLTGLGALAPVGALVLLVADSPVNGFGPNSTILAGDLTSSSVAPLALADASITTGERFGGDLVLGRAPVTTAGALPGGFTFENVVALQGSRFSLVFLPSLNSSSTTVTASTTYGLVSGADWLLPNVNGGESFSFSSSDANGPTSFFRVTVLSGAATNDLYTSSSGANLTMVPEPSAALLGVIGALGLLRRRRN